MADYVMKCMICKKVSTCEVMEYDLYGIKLLYSVCVECFGLFHIEGLEQLRELRKGLLDREVLNENEDPTDDRVDTVYKNTAATARGFSTANEGTAHDERPGAGRVRQGTGAKNEG